MIRSKRDPAYELAKDEEQSTTKTNTSIFINKYISIIDLIRVELFQHTRRNLINKENVQVSAIIAK